MVDAAGVAVRGVLGRTAMVLDRAEVLGCARQSAAGRGIGSTPATATRCSRRARPHRITSAGDQQRYRAVRSPTQTATRGNLPALSQPAIARKDGTGVVGAANPMRNHQRQAVSRVVASARPLGWLRRDTGRPHRTPSRGAGFSPSGRNGIHACAGVERRVCEPHVVVAPGRRDDEASGLQTAGLGSRPLLCSLSARLRVEQVGAFGREECSDVGEFDVEVLRRAAQGFECLVRTHPAPLHENAFGLTDYVPCGERCA